MFCGSTSYVHEWLYKGCGYCTDLSGPCTVVDLRRVQGMHAPGGPNSFNFMQFLGKFGKIVCWPPRGLAPPPRGIPGSATAAVW